MKRIPDKIEFHYTKTRKMARGLAVIDQEKCNQCGTCIDVYPRNAIVKL